MLMWGQKDTAKAWWQMEQAVTAGLVLHHITGKPRYLEMADGTLNFFMTYFVDRTYGEVYENRTKYGAQIWDLNKGSSGKAAYHSTELGYYVYLYGNLLLQKRTATLHYAFSPTGYPRDIRLTPLDLPDSALRITDVRLNGLPFTAVDFPRRILHIPAYEGGDFAVTFRSFSDPDAVVQSGAGVPVEMKLEQNYPNPFNPSTTIRFSLPAGESGVSGTGSRSVKLSVYDLLGREVAVLVNDSRPAGEYSVLFNGHGLSSGAYFYRLQADGRAVTKKFLLAR
jgi:hypothetical protein